MYSTSMPDEKKVLMASLGDSTIGSPEVLKLVLIPACNKNLMIY